jgi:hypothetical protein
MQDVQQQCDQLSQQMQDKRTQLQELQDAAHKLDARLEEGKLRRQKVHCSFKHVICSHLSIDRLCHLVVPDYRSRDPGSILGTTRFSEK